ncbi:hypothetical protein [Photorhabdus heterorhabditis]|uniref:hypothetical protein n=1 Tax=Photorhabdus heterorhabditis TaxID=880156 RepID=UPI001BD3C070|nr:hypothetical protein [Photorhabdus heterorhabditis]MBS9443901.1 polyketide cyclase [Photorhabdus heterorhabditis]
MLTSSFMLPVNASAEKIWPYYSDISLRNVWEDDLESITLEGDFITHNKGVMKLKDMPPMGFTLTSVEENKHFWDETIVPDLGSICFGHEILNIEEQLYIKHTVVFTKEKGEIEKDDIEFFKQLISDTPDAVWAIKQAVEA